jgi:hypothetical protein
MKYGIHLMLLDLVCWVGATALALYFGYSHVATAIGVLGCVVMSKELRIVARRIRSAKQQGDFSIDEMMEQMYHMGDIAKRLRCLLAISVVNSVDVEVVAQQIYTDFKGEVDIEKCREVVGGVIPSLLEDGEVIVGEDGSVTIDPEVMESVNLYKEMLEEEAAPEPTMVA